VDQLAVLRADERRELAASSDGCHYKKR
jgi:hypothetical protein